MDRDATTLHYLIVNGSLHELLVRLDRGHVDVDHRINGHTLLWWSVKTGHMHLAECLIMRGANVSAKQMEPSVWMDTALHQACYQANIDMVRYLLRQKADVHARGRYEMTPLLSCASVCNRVLRTTQCARLLLEHGADPNACDYRNYDAVTIAIKNRQPRLSDSLAYEIFSRPKQHSQRLLV